MNDDVPLPLQTRTSQRIFTYVITENLNTTYEEARVFEYGIECIVTNHKGVVISYKHIRCISPDFDKVYGIAYLFQEYQVYPEHMSDIIEDLLTMDELPEVIQYSMTA